MDATRWIGRLAVGGLVTLAGCLPPRDTLSARNVPPVPDAASSSEQAESAASPTALTTDDKPAADDAELIGQTVQGYIRRIDDLERRARRPAAASRPTLGARETSTRDVSPEKKGTTLSPEAASGGQASAATAADSTAPEDSPAGKEEETTGEAKEAIAPPVLGPVRVYARREPVPTAPPATPTAPGVNTPAVARQAPLSLEQFLRQWPGRPEDSSFRQQLDRRALCVIAGDYEAARAPLTMVSAEQQALASRFIEALIALREAHDGDPSGAATRILSELDALEEALRPLSELRLPTVALCRAVRGFGDYDPVEPPDFPAGLESEFVLYCELQDFVMQKGEDGLYTARFDMRTAILDDRGETVLEWHDQDIVDRCRRPRHDCFIPRLVRLPATLAPGSYVAKVTVIDRLGDKLAEGRATFRIVARP